MKANKWISMAMALTMTAGSGATAYAAELETPEEPSVPAAEQPAEQTDTAAVVEDMISQLEEDLAADETQADEIAAETEKTVPAETEDTEAAPAEQKPYTAEHQARLEQKALKIELARQLRENRLADKQARIALLDRLKELHAALEGQEMQDDDELVIELRSIQEQIKAYRQSRR
ncbi:hypothetical protein [uncultured Agathobaculum sp.]|uniref:hypothetical protein n=1 Tax=uncultured Agathobaculum sp. TaxID=2048140 RepID=UPI00296FBB7D